MHIPLPQPRLATRFIAAFLCAVFFVQPPLDAAPKLTDAQARVLIILNFINKYVEWPGNYNLRSTGYVNVCAHGNDAVTAELPVLKQASTPTLSVNVYINQQESYLSRCHVVYIADSKHQDAGRILQLVGNAPVLTVSAAPRFIDQGGAVGLTSVVERQGNFERTFVRYEVNRGQFARAQLRLDPDALELAARVLR